MTTIQRLTDSCVLLTSDDNADLFDPGFHTYETDEFDLSSLGDVSRIFISHEHGDHVSPGFVRWLIDRNTDLIVYSNAAVADLLAREGIEVVTDVPDDVSAEDVLHGKIATGATPPNRAFTVKGVLTHPGDSREPTVSAPVLALPLLVPWDSITGAVAHARNLSPNYVVPIHDFYLTSGGREFASGMAKRVLAADDIEVVELDWGQSFSL